MTGCPRDSNRGYFRLGLLICFILIVLTQPALGKSKLTPSRIASELSKHLPQFNGELVDVDGETIYAAVDVGKPVPREVEIYRRDLAEGAGGPRIVEEFVGLGRIQTYISGRLAQLDVTPQVADKIEVGDELRPRQLDISVRLTPGASSQLVRETLGEKLLELRAVRAVKFDTDPPVEEMNGPVLTVREATVTLTQAGDTEYIFCSRKKKSSKPATDSDRLVRKLEFDFNLRDFLYRRPEETGSPQGELVLGGDRRLGWAGVSLTTGVLSTEINWTEIDGEILALNAVEDSVDGNSDNFSLLVTYSRRGSVYTAFYTWLSNQEKFLEQWRRKHTWIQRINGDYYRFRIGLTQPFGSAPEPVTVSRRGVESAAASTFSLSGGGNPSAIERSGNYLWFLDGAGHLVVKQAGEEIYRTETTFGDGPQSVSARREKYKTTLHPGLAIHSETGRQVALLAANGGGSWNFIRSLQEFTESRVFLFELEPRRNKLRKRWESQRLSGVVEKIRSNLILTVEAEAENSVIYEFKF